MQKIDDTAEMFLKIMRPIKRTVLHVDEETHDLVHIKTHYPVLAQLKDNGTMKMSDLCVGSLMSKPHLTVVVDKLIHDGMIERKVSEEDRRVIYISLTPQGKKFTDMLRSKIMEIIKKNLSSLDNSDIEVLHKSLTDMRRILLKITNNEINKK